MLKTFQTYKLIIITVSLVAVFLIVILQLLWAENLELMAYDIRSRFRMKPAATDIVIVNIDNTTLEKVKNKKELGFGRFPWPRTVISKAMQFISSGNPQLILVDLNVEGDTLYTDKAFSDQTFIEHLEHIPATFFVQSIRISEEELKLNALQQLEQFKTQQSFNRNDISQEKINQSLEMLIKQIKQDEPPSKELTKHFFNVNSNLSNINNNKLSYYQINKMLDGLYKYSTKVGANLSFSDSDRVVRSYQPVFLYYGKFFFSVPLAVSCFVNKTKNITLNDSTLVLDNKNISLNKNLRFFLNWRKKVKLFSKTDLNFFDIPLNMHYKSIPFYKVFFNNDYKINADIFKDKIVIIGTTATATKDFQRIPNQENFYGVEIIATAIDNLINDTDFIRKAPISINLLITSMLIITGISLIYLFRFKFPESYINLYSSLILIMLAYIVINLYLFVKLSYWADLIFPEIVYIIVTSAIIIVTSLIDKDKRSQVENTFSKYVSPQVYKALLENYNKVSLTADRMTITVLFSDIRGFTAFSEELYPEQVARNLNEYFNEMVKVILKYNGTVDKFMGDAIMAFFGAPLPDKNHCLNAIKAAIEMKESLDKLNDKWYKMGRKTLNIGIGINTGQALVGNFGSDQLMDFTVIGDTVNLASRLESLNKQENTNILISAFTYKHVKDKVNVNIIGPRTVKGKSESVVVYEVLNIKPD